MLLDVLSHLGRRLTRARPRDMVIANVVRRVLALVRSEDAEAQAAREGGLNGSPSDQAQDTCSATQSPKRAGHELERNGAPQLGGRADAGEPSFFKSSMLDLFSAEEQLDNTTPVSSQARPPKGDDAKLDGLREDILDGLQELQDEVKQAEEQIAEYAPQYIHNRAVVLVNQTSRVAQRFLVAAAKKAKFTAIFVESSSRYHYRGAPASSHPSSSVPPDTMSRQEFLAPLKKVGISVSVVSLTSLPPILKWCTHLITVPSIVFADGSYLGPAGLDMLVGAAQDHDILVLMLSAVYMIAPLTQLNYEGLLSPDRSNLSSWYEDTDLLGSSSGIKLRAVDDEHVRPNPSTLLITNL